MKKILCILFISLPLLAGVAFADPPGPPGPGGDPGGTGGVPVGSPIDGQTIILLVIAFAYAVYKLIDFRKQRSPRKTTR
ncbi:MAG TPA: hypothetical protein PKJ28_09560 [Bacteroidales bacterium]|mgnify:CR=1 FL=1|nr:hypothetical protein [Bacteroidales bacterium]HPS72662.1 hypothetical protein [Bacteroidales bacterium]